MSKMFRCPAAALSLTVAKCSNHLLLVLQVGGSGTIWNEGLHEPRRVALVGCVCCEVGSDVGRLEGWKIGRLQSSNLAVFQSCNLGATIVGKPQSWIWPFGWVENGFRPPNGHIGRSPHENLSSGTNFLRRTLLWASQDPGNKSVRKVWKMRW